MLNKEFAYRETFINAAPNNKYNFQTKGQSNLMIDTSMHNVSQDNIMSILQSYQPNTT